MRLITAVAVLFVACFSALSVSADPECAAWAQAVPICTVLENPAKYDGKLITVEGLYRPVIHGSVLYGSACSETYVNMRAAADDKKDKHASKVMRSLTKKEQFQPVEVVLRGTFRAAQEGHCFGQNCLLYEIEEHELLCARTLEPFHENKTSQ